MTAPVPSFFFILISTWLLIGSTDALGEACNVTNPCTDATSEVCDANGTCVCQPGYSASETLGFCVQDGLPDGVCLPTVPNCHHADTSVCLDGRCVCVDNHTLVGNGLCKEDGRLGGICLVTEPVCLDNNTYCATGGRCFCFPEYDRIQGECFRNCTNTPPIENGDFEIIAVRNPEKYFAANYTCRSGFDLVGQPIIRCYDNGTNVDAPPTCSPQPAVCSPACVNGGSCTVNEVNNTNYCLCPSGFSGVSCEVEDFCVADPCPSNAVDCVPQPDASPPGRACVCPDGLKGANCDQPDAAVVCRSVNQTVYFDTQNPATTLCLPTTSTTSAIDVCHNPDEEIVYTLNPDPTKITQSNNNNGICLTYIDTAPTNREDCFEVTAFEADDVTLRPWINATFTVCFIFNNPPSYTGPATLNYNVQTDTVKQVTLTSADVDSHQAATFSISAIDPTTKPELLSLITVSGSLMTINPPGTNFFDPGTTRLDATVRLQLIDNGVPALTSSASVVVTFLNESLSCSVSASPIHVHLNPAPTSRTQVGTITCELRGTSTSQYTYQVAGTNHPVDVDSSGQVLYDPSSTNNEGSFDVTVTIATNTSVEVTTDVTFTLIAADFTPTCTASSDTATLTEKTAIGACSLSLYTCTDAGNLVKTCTDTSTSFSVSCTTTAKNAVQVKACVDASLDNNPRTHQVSAAVSNAYASHSLAFNVDVTNVNDPPQITRVPGTNVLEFSITDADDVNAVAGIVAVSDPDVGLTGVTESLTVSLSDATDSAISIPFSATMNAAMDAVTIAISTKPDPAVRHDFTLRLQVTDAANASDVIDIRITINDTNEAPVCPDSSQNVTVFVQEPIGFMVLTVSCPDGDFTQPFYDLAFTLSGDPNVLSYFAITSSTGIITLAKPLTDITTPNALLTFDVNVRDGGGLSDSFQINVQVSNDLPPNCTDQLTKTLSERTTKDVCSTIVTNCVEPVQNGALTYRLGSGNGTQLFRLGTYTNTHVELCTTTDLQGNPGTYMLYIVVSSTYAERQLAFTLYVNDVNDAAVFTKALYEADVNENTTAGTPVITVAAVDPDSGLIGEVLYQIKSSNIPFSMDEVNGVISVASQLDADTAPSVYTLTVSARDGTQNPIESTAEVRITINDVNDNQPSCTGGNLVNSVNLLDPVGTLFQRLVCSDDDVTTAYNAMTYAITPASAYFSVNDTGHLTIASALPRNTAQHVIEIVVANVDQPSLFQTKVTVTVNVNTAIGPVCDQSNIVLNLREDATVRGCPGSEVICSDPTGGTVRLQGQSGNARPLMDIRVNDISPSLGLSACVNMTLKDRFGTFTLQGVVTNDLAPTTVTWTITISNVNEPPVFLPDTYNVTVDEFASSSNPIHTITVTDPDDGKGDQSFEFSYTSAQLINDADFGGAFFDSFLYVNGAKEFYYTKDVNATVRNLFVYRVTAFDGEGLTSTALVTIHIRDINSAPACLPVTDTIQTTILATTGTQLHTLACYDVDIDPDNLHLDYRITSGDKDNYFNVTGDGVLVVAKALPRTRLYNTGSATMNIAVSDRGSPSLDTSLTLTVNVDNNIPAECTVGVTPPDIWVQGKCATITMDCTDPTTSGISHLTYTPEGNYTVGFNLKSNVGGTMEICYTKVTSGVFEVAVKVYNGLTTGVFRETIIVDYEKATPVFNTTRFTHTISEDTAAGILAIAVSATSANLIGTLVYHIDAVDSLPGWSQYFSLNSVTGVISVVGSLRPLANQVIILKLEAEDTGSKLRSSTQIELTIEDINERPQCVIDTSDYTGVSVDSAPGTAVLTFHCTDADVKPEYKTLTYSLNADVQSVFEIRDVTGTPPGKAVVTLSLLDINTERYPLTLTVEDGGTPALSYQRAVNVTINRLPPPLTVNVNVLSYDTVNVNWTFTRDAYYSVTNAYRIMLNPGTNPVIVDVTSVNVRSRNVTGLSAATTYTLTVTASTTYGDTTSGGIIITTPQVPVLNHVTFTIHVLSHNYDALLRNPISALYQTTTTDIVQQLETVLAVSAGFVRVAVKGYRPANSVYVDGVVTVNEVLGSANGTLLLLENAVQSGWIQTLSVNSSYFVASVGLGYVAINGAIHVDVDPVFNGSDVTMTCGIATVGYNTDVTFTYWWSYRTVRITPLSTSSRYVLSVQDVAGFPELKQSLLRISPALHLKDGVGAYTCHVSDGVSEASSDVTITLIPQPGVVIEPRSVTIAYNTGINITCTTITALAIFDRFVWYKDGQPFTQGADDRFMDEGTRMILQVARLEENAVFGCAGENQAGRGQMAFSYVNVLPDTPPGQSVVLCPEVEDSRGTVWDAAPPGATSTKRCPADTSGVIYRECTAAGTWRLPVYDCTKDALRDIEETLTGTLDGVSSPDVPSEVQRLAEGTDNVQLYEGDLDSVLNSMATVVEITDDQVTPAETNNFLRIASNMIDERNKDSWISRIEVKEEGAIDIPRLVEEFVAKKFPQIKADQKLNENNIHLEIGVERRASYEFPDRTDISTPQWLQDTRTSITISGDAINGRANLRYASSFYRSIPPILVKKLKDKGVVRDISGTLDINSDIVSFQLQDPGVTIDPPAQITFQHFDANYSNPICVYWNFSDQAFSTDGCYLVSTNDETTVCACNHFTNFAVLMSPGKTPVKDALALSIISAVGCAISMLCLLLTILAYICMWSYVKSDRAVLLMNLCACLIIAYALFLGGVTQTQDKATCTVIAALLHFFYLTVFFLMLAYGIEIAISVIYVFVTRSRLRYLLPAAWGIPLVIVAISLGATQTEGFGNEDFCWLSIEDGLLWAFVAPALLVIAVNFLIVLAVFRKMYKSHAMMTKSDKEKAKTGVRSLCVLLPILGLTWVFGVFSVNEEMVIFQYLFAIFNSLQGLFIFIFHCLLNAQLREGFRKRSHRKKSLASMDTTTKNPHSSSFTGSSAFVSSDVNKPALYNDPSSGASTNPFLEADRQMKELVAKNKKTGANLYDNNAANNKVEKASKTVDLDDVKISNILRESGTAGVSSIYTTDPKPEVRPEPETKDTPPETNALRQSQNLDPPYSRSDYPESASPSPRNSGYEKYQQPLGSSNRSYEHLQKPHEDSKSRSTGSHSGTDDSKKREKQRQKEMEKEREKAEAERREREKREKERKEKERVERERKQREREKEREREHKEREKERERERERERKEKERVEKQKHVSSTIHVGYERPGYSSQDKLNKTQRSSRSSRSDDDRQARVDERNMRLTTVYMPYAYMNSQVTSSSSQNITSISTALPQKYDPYQGAKSKPKDSSMPRKSGESGSKKDKHKKKPSVKDRSRAYEYSYESTYLGGQSRHASLENMNAQYGYSPYGNMPGMGGYQTGRPSHQQAQWDQYRDPYGYQPQNDPYSRDRRDHYW